MKDGSGWGWLFLILAIGFELSGTLSMKLSQGFAKLWPSILMFVCYGISFTSLNFALNSFKISVAYAIWSGAGIILITVAGVVFFSERLSLASFLWIAVIVAGVVGLNMSAKVH
ncbi:DMT family transporter [Paenibacillus pinihumi]|uniref:DMT family transporter n=1 Tax=Paenibacillus pinihumi TaxID=669462 RepID=UPI0004225D82|nr:multidrug efflux SMR transporter [Paenibacillus pinihumi]